MTDHDFTDPLSQLNAIEMAWLAADSTVSHCDHCQVTHRMLPMMGTAWGLDVSHEPHCPEQDDNQPYAESGSADSPNANDR
jgi:hypothetical protein